MVGKILPTSETVTVKGLQRFFELERGFPRLILRQLEPEVPIVLPIVRRQVEPTLSAEMLIRFGLALWIEFKPQMPAPIAFRIIRVYVPRDFQMVFEPIEGLIEQRAQQACRQRLLEGLNGSFSAAHTGAIVHIKKNASATVRTMGLLYSPSTTGSSLAPRAHPELRKISTIRVKS